MSIVNQNTTSFSTEGTVTTVVVHLILLLCFYFFGIKPQLPEIPEQGILISFEETNEGTGENLPSSAKSNPKKGEIDKMAEDNAKKEDAKKANRAKGAVDNKVETTDNPDAPSLPERSPDKAKDTNKSNKKDTNKNKDNKDESAPSSSKELVKEEPTVDERALFKTKDNNESTDAKSSTNTETDVSQDMPNNASSDPNVKKQSAETDVTDPSINNSSFSNKGVSALVSGRRLVSSPNIAESSQYEGKVTVRVYVDKAGNVIKAEYQSSGSTTSNVTLKNNALKRAKGSKFNLSNNAPEVQTGTMTFIYKVG